MKLGYARVSTDPPVVGDALFSTDLKCRYLLSRMWNGDDPPRIANFIMLNPSDAGAEKNDPTVRKDIGFARRWGYNGILVTNLRPDVSTDPWDLTPWRGIDPENSRYLKKAMLQSDIVIAAWGSQPIGVERRIAISELIFHVRGLACCPLYCIGETQRGAPLHPSRAAYTDAPILWRDVA